MSRTLDLTYTDVIAPTDSLKVADSGNGVYVKAIEVGGSALTFLSREDTERLTRALAEYLGLEMQRHAPKVFKENAALGEVRKGDLVRTRFARNGVDVVHEGVADHDWAMGDWRTAEYGWLRTADARANGGTITILDRPEPELPTDDGAIVRFNALNGFYAFNHRSATWRRVGSLTGVLTDEAARGLASAGGFTVMTLTEKEAS